MATRQTTPASSAAAKRSADEIRRDQEFEAILRALRPRWTHAEKRAARSAVTA